MLASSDGCTCYDETTRPCPCHPNYKERRILDDKLQKTQDDLTSLAAKIKSLHQYMKRGGATEDHGVHGNLACIYDHVISLNMAYNRLRIAFGVFAFKTGEAEGVWFVEEGGDLYRLADKCEQAYKKWIEDKYKMPFDQWIKQHPGSEETPDF